MKNATKTIPQILRENICTVFNLLNLIIAISLATVGAWKNILFIFIILINTVIGILQEIKAKRQIERLTLLAQPTVTVLSNGCEKTITPNEIKKGDILVFTAGCTVCTDCIITDGKLEVNESVLTGESKAVDKNIGDKLLSGSNVISGRCLALAECGTDKCFTAKMLNDVKKIKCTDSELMSSMKKITRLTGFFIIPIGILLFAQAYFFRSTPLESAVIATSAGLLGMLPKGLVLLISIGLAVGVIRLSKKNVLIRDLHSLENLAHCDTVCLDKTGTLTEGSLEVDAVYPYIDKPEFDRLMATYLVNTTDNNSTYRALCRRFSKKNPYTSIKTIPFSSERKYSSVTLSDGRTLILGAPETLCNTIPSNVKRLMADGKRILFVGLCRENTEIKDISVAATIVITDKLRKNAIQTIDYFYNQGVDVKIISGDNPSAAAAIAKQAGVRHTERVLDATGLGDKELAEAVKTNTVFGRVTPQQKKTLITALQKNGHTVAMTGDGVNDLLAMRQADCSIAMGNGSDAARQTAELVLLDSDFTVLRDVISEGRRVINNLTKSAGVFFIKTIYSILLSILCLIMNTDFPFIPIQITLIDAVIEAFPAFFMSFERNDRKINGKFIDSAIKAALPNSIAIIICCIIVFLAAPHFNIVHTQINLILYLTVGIVSLAGVVKSVLPFNLFHGFLIITSIFGFFCAVLLFAPLLQLPHLALNSAILLTVVTIPGIVLSILLKLPVATKSTVLVRK